MNRTHILNIFLLVYLHFNLVAVTRIFPLGPICDFLRTCWRKGHIECIYSTVLEVLNAFIVADTEGNSYSCQVHPVVSLM